MISVNVQLLDYYMKHQSKSTHWSLQEPGPQTEVQF